MTSKTFVIGWSKTGLVWTTHSLMCAKILDSDIIVVSLHGNAVSPVHVIKMGQCNVGLGQARHEFQALLDT